MKMTTVYKNARINGEITDLEIENGVFSKIGKTNKSGTDLGGRKVYPGLFDIHIHGCIGLDTMDADHLAQMSEFLLSKGTTSYLPTTMTMDYESIKKVTDADIKGFGGANVVGFHMEGPYINPKYKGAMNEDFIRKPDLCEMKDFKNVKMITVAPESDGAMEFIKNCSCTVSIGHTDADYECATEAIKNGAKCLTHTFNAMPPLHHREPAVIGAAADGGIYAQVITDGLHLHPGVVRMIYKIFGPDRMIIISDAMCATGMPDGDYMFGGSKMTVKNAVARTQGGALAGSTTLLFDCVKKAIEFGIPEEDAFKMASQTPANLLGVKKGAIKEGYDAEFIVLNDDMSLYMAVNEVK